MKAMIAIVLLLVATSLCYGAPEIVRQEPAQVDESAPLVTLADGTQVQSKVPQEQIDYQKKRDDMKKKRDLALSQQRAGATAGPTAPGFGSGN